jgi:hypothetical protein
MTDYINSKKLTGIPPGRGSYQQGAHRYESFKSYAHANA